MQLRLELALPRDARYVGMMRNLAHGIFRDLGAPQPVTHDVCLALSEACTNAVRHATGVDEYEVIMTVEDGGCTIEVVDLGPGFVPVTDVEWLRSGVQMDPDTFDDESGRGLVLMQALVDDLEFAVSEEGTRVRLRKDWSGDQLGLKAGAPVGGPG